MRPLLLGLFFASSLSIAAPTPPNIDPAAFEKRFRTADKDKNGKLSRDEAYAEFPRMPEYFDEIDRNKDNAITLKEVKQAMERRVNAAMNAAPGDKFYAPAAGESTSGSATSPQFSSKSEARRQYRYDYYESLAGSLEDSRLRNQPTQPQPYPSVLNKSF